MNWLRSRLPQLFGIDLRTLALFRAALGLVLLCDMLLRLPDARVFYSDAGVMPRTWLALFNDPWRLSLHTANGHTWFAAALLLLEALAALALALGWRTRLAALACFVLEASLLNRNGLVLIGGDVLLCCLLFWALFLPLGARWSVDATLSSAPPPAENQHLSWASAGLLMQVMSVYFFSAILKSDPVWWPNGTAVWYALQLDMYATPLAVWLRQFPDLLSALTYYVWFLELLGPLLIFSPLLSRPLRFVLMLMFMTMHIGFFLCLELGPFPFISITSLTSFAGGWIWDALDRRAQRREARRGALPLRIYYDRDCGFCLKMCRLFRTFLVLPRAEILPAQDYPRARALLEANWSWVVIDHDDHAALKWPAYVLLLRRSPLFAWLGLLLAGGWLEPAGNAVYDFVGRHRGAFGRLSAALLPERAERFGFGTPGLALVGGAMLLALLGKLWMAAVGSFAPPGAAAGSYGVLAALLVLAVAVAWLGVLEKAGRERLAQAGAATMAGLVLAWNLCSIEVLPKALYSALTPPFRLARIDQYWNMFAPFPSKDDGWYVFPGELADGSQLDVLHPERAGVSYDKPQYISGTYANIRWHKYQENLWLARFANNRYWYGKYLCRDWNASHSGGRQLKTFKMIYMLEETPPPGQPATVEQRILWRHECLKESPDASGAEPTPENSRN
jgi:hypothetical protein